MTPEDRAVLRAAWRDICAAPLLSAVEFLSFALFLIGCLWGLPILFIIITGERMG